MTIKIECHGTEVRSYEAKDAAIAWMQNFGNRVGIGYDQDRHVLVDDDGKRWIQLGYVLLPEADWLKKHNG